MRCPFCFGPETKVLDKRETGTSLELTRRRRSCLKCSKRFTTYEKAHVSNLVIIMKDNRKEAFDQTKLKEGIKKACEKRQITDSNIDTLINMIESQLRRRKDSEIKSKTIGELVIKKLQKMDKVAYLRFASVYKDFSNLKDFQREVKALTSK